MIRLKIKFPKSKRARYISIGSAIFLVVAIFALALLLRHREGSSVAGKDAGVVLTDYAGQTVRFDSFVSVLNSKPLVVYFWATWCPYCTEEFSNLSKIKAQYGDRMQVVAVDRGESPADAKGYTDALGLSPGIVYLLDREDALFKKLGGYAVPETIFINARGEEVFHKHGPITAEEMQAAAAQIAK